MHVQKIVFGVAVSEPHILGNSTISLIELPLYQMWCVGLKLKQEQEQDPQRLGCSVRGASK